MKWIVTALVALSVVLASFVRVHAADVSPIEQEQQHIADVLGVDIPMFHIERLPNSEFAIGEMGYTYIAGVTSEGKLLSANYWMALRESYDSTEMETTTFAHELGHILVFQYLLKTDEFYGNQFERCFATYGDRSLVGADTCTALREAIRSGAGVK